MLPVPLNSSYMTSSMREPVSTRAVASMVTEPPSSRLRAVPKNFFGGWSAPGSSPPERVLPEAGTSMLYALASLVIESSSIMTSFPVSARRFALSMTICATLTWCLVSSSKVEYMTSECFRLLFMSVTSSGLSSTSSTMSSISGYLSSTEAAIFLSNTVLPAFG